MSNGYEEGTRLFPWGWPAGAGEGGGGGGRGGQQLQRAAGWIPELMKIMLEGNFSPLLGCINYSIVFGWYVSSRDPSTYACVCVLVSRLCDAGIILAVWSKENLPPYLLKEI